MPIYALALGDYVKTDLRGKTYIDDRIKNKDFRKKLIRDSILEEFIEATEKCVADKHKTIKDTNTKMYREMPYEEDYGWCNYGRDARLTGIIYYNKIIKDIYRLKRLEFIKAYRQERALSFIEIIYPTKMPKEDYFPFADFDLDAEIPLLLTTEEKKRWDDGEGGLEIMSRVEISDYDWNYGIFWIDSHRVFMNLECEAYYFKQVGKDTHFFAISYPCT